MLAPVKRVVLVIAEGIHPEAIPFYSLFNLKRIIDRGASAFAMPAFSSSTQASRLISICTGVHPDRHGIFTNQLLVSRALTRLEPIGQTIGSEGFQVSVFGPEEPADKKGRAMILGRELGFQHLTLRGNTSSEVVSAAINALCSQRRGLVVLRFSDCTAAERDGWASPAYALACRRLDQSIGIVTALSGAGSGDSLLVILGDHRMGGKSGTVQRADHERSTMLTLFGRGVSARTLEDASLLDVAPTILWSVGIPVPRQYEGKPLLEAFGSVEPARAMA